MRVAGVGSFVAEDRPQSTLLHIASIGREVRQHEQVRPHGAGDFGESGCSHEIDTLRYGQHLSGRNGDPLGITAARQEGADFVAHRPADHIGADLVDYPAAFKTEPCHCSGWWGVNTLTLQGIGAIHPGRCNANHHLACAGDRVGYLGPDEVIGPAWFRHGDRAHHACLSSR